MARRRKLTKAESKRLTIRTHLTELSLYDLEGSPEGAAERILVAASAFEDDYDNLFYRVEDYGGCDGVPVLVLVGEKQEADEAYNRRIKKLQDQKNKRIDAEIKREKKLLKQLLEKYGD